MQGRKEYTEKLFVSFQLSERVPKENFYRRLKEVLDLHFLYDKTKKYYGSCGQKSVDPVVFFKLCLVGYLENIISDRALIRHSSMRLDILYFVDHDINDKLPCYSSISRTRQLFPEEVFEEVFERILRMCMEKGMVSGHTQTIDSAPVKANASMDSLELKVPKETLDEHLRKVRTMSEMDKPIRKTETNKASEEQRTLDADESQLKSLATRQEKWSKDQNQRPGAGNKGSKYTSNKTHYSPTDPDARISVKPGKARKLNYMSQLSVDTGHHVITDIQAYHADKKDNQYLQDISKRLKKRLNTSGFLWQNLVADTGYSSGENYAFLEEIGLTSYIPPHGTYKGGPEGFRYEKAGNYWVCRNGKHVTFRKQKEEKGTLKDVYFTTRKDCKDCPFKAECIGKQHEKRISITAYREEYERNNARVRSKRGWYMKKLRQSTVEPVFGTLTQHLGLRKINTLGIKQANKVMHLSAMAYNLKKYLKFTEKRAKAEARAATLAKSVKAVLQELYILILSEANFTLSYT